MITITAGLITRWSAKAWRRVDSDRALVRPRRARTYASSPTTPAKSNEIHGDSRALEEVDVALQSANEMLKTKLSDMSTRGSFRVDFPDLSADGWQTADAVRRLAHMDYAEVHEVLRRLHCLRSFDPAAEERRSKAMEGDDRHH